MASPSKGQPWPESLRLESEKGAVQLALGKRAIAMGPDDVAECEDDSLLRNETIVGYIEAGGEIRWHVGPIATSAERPLCACASDVYDAVAKGNTVFLKRGHNYRGYNASFSTAPEHPVAKTAESEPTVTDQSPLSVIGSVGAASGTSPDETVAGENSPESAKAGRTRKQYSKAVAFEFVNGIIGNVLGTEAAEAAWASPS